MLFFILWLDYHCDYHCDYYRDYHHDVTTVTQSNVNSNKLNAKCSSSPNESVTTPNAGLVETPVCNLQPLIGGLIAKIDPT